MAEDRAIGKDNDLLWRLKDDLRLFKKTTLGSAVVMGRKTFESLGKPLPGRTNYVITRDENYSADGIEVLNDLDEVQKLPHDSIFVLGGGQIYKALLPQVSTMYISHVNARFPKAEAYFPEWDESNFKCVKAAHYSQNERNEYSFVFRTWVRK